MKKFIIFLFSMSLASFDSSQSISFNCSYITESWGNLGTIYYCNVHNSVSITSVDAAQIDDISGTHKAGYDNDNVEGLNVYDNGQIHHFPRGINKFFKNLKGIGFGSNGLKEIHQSDLKYFPKLVDLRLYYNKLEILEENLFEFNPNLEEIHLNSNKISHIDPNVFDKLTKLNTLLLSRNTCINMGASNNQTAVQKVIKTIQAQCINLDYSNLEQKIKNIESESKDLNLEKLKNESKNSKYSNFHQQKIHDLKATKALEGTTTLTPKFTTTTAKPSTTVTTTTTKAPENIEISKLEACSALESKLAKIEINLEKYAEKINQMDQGISKSDQKITEIDEKVSKLSKDMSTTLRDIESSNNQNFAAIMKFIENFDKKMEAIEEKLDGMDNNQKILMDKVNKIQSKSHNNK